MRLWLDDRRAPRLEYRWARTYMDAVQIVRRHTGDLFEEASLDHDLGSGPTGYDFVNWMESNERWPNVIRLHTDNPVGRENMVRVIEHSGLYVPDPKERRAYILKEIANGP